MEAIGHAYRQLHDNRDEIPYDVIPVKAWQQLAAKARHNHWVSHLRGVDKTTSDV
jgi:hypothetical protein